MRNTGPAQPDTYPVRRLPIVLALAAVVLPGLIACGSSSTTSASQCVPVNVYDHRCDQAAPTTHASGPTRVRLTSPSHLTYVIDGPAGVKANLIQYAAGPDPEYDAQRLVRPGSANDWYPLPVKIEVNVKAGTVPWVRWAGAPTAACKILISGHDMALAPRANSTDANLVECFGGTSSAIL